MTKYPNDEVIGIHNSYLDRLDKLNIKSLEYRRLKL